MTTDWRDARADEVRALILHAEPDITEEIKWRKPSNPDGVPTFSLDGLVLAAERPSRTAVSTVSAVAPCRVANTAPVAGSIDSMRSPVPISHRPATKIRSRRSRAGSTAGVEAQTGEPL